MAVRCHAEQSTAKLLFVHQCFNKGPLHCYRSAIITNLHRHAPSLTICCSRQNCCKALLTPGMSLLKRKSLTTSALSGSQISCSHFSMPQLLQGA